MRVTYVIAGTVVATGLTVLNQILNGGLSIKPIIGGFIVGTSLLTMALFSAPIAAALALLLLVTSVMVNTIPILQKVSGYIS